MARRGRPVVIVQAACVLACCVAGSHVAFGQSSSTGGLSLPGINLGIIKTTPATLGGSSGGNVVLPGISVGGLVTVAPSSITASSSGTSVAVGSVSVAGGLATVAPTSISATRQGVSATLPSANVANVATVSTTTASVGPTGIAVAGPAVNVANTVTVSQVTASVSQNGIAVTGPAINAANLVNISPTSAELGSNGLQVVVSGVKVAGGLVEVSPTEVGLSKDGLSLNAPDLSVGGVKLETSPIVVDLSGTGPLLQLGDSGVVSVINQTTLVSQAVANMAMSEAMAPIDQVLGGLAFGEDATASCVDTSSVALAATPELGINSWNAAAMSRGEHDGYRVSGDVPACASAVPFQTLQRTFLPGTVWDASKSFGMTPGTLHFGFSGGTSESDTRIKATDAVRQAGFTSGGNTRLISRSIGGYSLLTKENWYAGTALGAAWGKADTENHIIGSSSEYDTSGYVVASFVGTVLPVTEMLRFDLRGTLSFQRTVGDAHVDSIGVAHSDHIIHSTDASISGRLFGVFRSEDTIVRPFVQAGITHHLSYDNQLKINGVAFSLHEADTSLFTAAGVDFEINRAFQFSIGVRHDYSSDEENVTGRIGLTARFN